MLDKIHIYVLLKCYGSVNVQQTLTEQLNNYHLQ
jgi:hypothetical protein